MNDGTIRYDGERALKYSGSSSVTKVTSLTKTLVDKTIYYYPVRPHHIGLTFALTEEHT